MSVPQTGRAINPESQQASEAGNPVRMKAKVAIIIGCLLAPILIFVLYWHWLGRWVLLRQQFGEAFFAPAAFWGSLLPGLAVCILLGRGLLRLVREDRLKRRWAALFFCLAMIPLVPFPYFALKLASAIAAQNGMSLYHGCGAWADYVFPVLYMLVITVVATLIFFTAMMVQSAKQPA